MDPITNGAVSEAASGWLAKHTGKTALLILAVLMLVSLGKSADTKFTYDEYVTYRIAALPSAGDVWRFFADGLDTTGPLSALIAYATGRSGLCSELAMRLPFSLIALGFGLGMFGCLRRRYPAGFALAALLVPLEMPKVAELLVQARAYPIVLGCAGMAIWFWQSAAEGRWRPWSVAGLMVCTGIGDERSFLCDFAFAPVFPGAVSA
jgi:hypothetical protein